MLPASSRRLCLHRDNHTIAPVPTGSNSNDAMSKSVIYALQRLTIHPQQSNAKGVSIFMGYIVINYAYGDAELHLTNYLCYINSLRRGPLPLLGLMSTSQGFYRSIQHITMLQYNATVVGVSFWKRSFTYRLHIFVKFDVVPIRDCILNQVLNERLY